MFCRRFFPGVAIPEVFLVLRFGSDSTPVVPDILIEKSFCASSVLWSEHFLINPSLAELFPLREQEGCPRSLLPIGHLWTTQSQSIQTRNRTLGYQVVRTKQLDQIIKSGKIGKENATLSLHLNLGLLRLLNFSQYLAQTFFVEFMYTSFAKIRSCLVCLFDCSISMIWWVHCSV